MVAQARTQDGPVPPSDTYETLMQVAWNFDYQSQAARLDDLYHRATESQWNAADLDWDRPIDPSGPIMAPEHSQYASMPFFRRLAPAQQETFRAHATAQLLSQFLHGEQGSLLAAAAVAHGVLDMKAKSCAAAQTADEARHVEVYHRYVNRVAIQYPVVTWLKKLIDFTLQTNSVHKHLIGMNMIVEGLALGALNSMYRQANEPLLRSITFNVMRDESRHVSFGHLFLAPAVAAMHPDDREDLAQFAFDAVRIMLEGQTGTMDQGFLKVLEVSGIEAADFTVGLAEAAGLGISRWLPPGQAHSVQDLMMPTLVRVGLVTPRTKPLFEAAGIAVKADLSVLDAMVERPSIAIATAASQTAG